ncbi:MAG: hypothetical protein IKS08_00025 [Alphaproteobacteria bacterium]|nr:hypothetical protein [Alphaproteobacteria bacterium]
MKKIALTSLLAVFAISSANAATNYFVGGGLGMQTNNEHNSYLSLTPEFGWKLNSNWDLGAMAIFSYDHHYNVDGDGLYHYGAGAFARYKVAQAGRAKLLLKGGAGVIFGTVSSEDDAIDGETFTSIEATIIPMVTYDISESFTLFANLNFLGVYAHYNFENEDMNIKESWRMGAVADSNTVMNTSDFQIGFIYNF